MADEYATGGPVSGPPRIAQFVLTWHPYNGPAQEVPLERDVSVRRGTGRFVVTTRHIDISEPEAERIQEAIDRAAESPGKTFEVDL